MFSGASVLPQWNLLWPLAEVHINNYKLPTFVSLIQHVLNEAKNETRAILCCNTSHAVTEGMNRKVSFPKRHVLGCKEMKFHFHCTQQGIIQNIIPQAFHDQNFPLQILCGTPLLTCQDALGGQLHWGSWFWSWVLALAWILLLAAFACLSLL